MDSSQPKPIFSQSHIVIIVAIIFFFSASLAGIGVYIWQQTVIASLRRELDQEKGLVQSLIEQQNKQKAQKEQEKTKMSEELRIMCLYEKDNAIVFTTEKPAYANIYHWINPAFKAETYMERSVKFDSSGRQLFTKGMGYQIKTYATQDASFLSDEYFFEGNRMVFGQAECANQIAPIPSANPSATF